jgi:hypothetical protein
MDSNPTIWPSIELDREHVPLSTLEHQSLDVLKGDVQVLVLGSELLGQDRDVHNPISRDGLLNGPGDIVAQIV